MCLSRVYFRVISHIPLHGSQEMSGGRRSRSFSRDFGYTYILVNSVVYLWFTNRPQKTMLSNDLVICLAVAGSVCLLFTLGQGLDNFPCALETW